jgi:rhamnogalacturonyl hydrolase YesR
MRVDEIGKRSCSGAPTGWQARAAAILALAGLVAFGARAQLRQTTASPPLEVDRIARVARLVADREAVRAASWPPDWQHAVLAMGLLAAAEALDEPRYLQAAVRYAEANRWRPGTRHYHPDDHAVGQIYLDLYRLEPDPRRLAAFRAAIDRLRSQPWRWSKSHQQMDYWWSDALFMSPPALAKLAAVTGDPSYLEWADERWRAAHGALFDTDDGLFYRDPRYLPRAPAGVRRQSTQGKVFWARGNAWVLAGAARLLTELPPEHRSRAFYEGVFRELAAALATRQGSDGLWRADLGAPPSGAPGETSASALACYGLAWGINTGLLEEARYRPAVERAWWALAMRVTGDGRLGWVQGPGSEPADVAASDNAPYGAGALLLAASEVLRLASP